MNCSDAQYLMPLYLSGELDSVSMAKFDRHAAECPSCRRQLEEQLDLDKNLRSVLQREPVNTTAVRDHVHAAMKNESMPLVRYSMLLPKRVPVAVAAALLVMVSLGLAYRDNVRYEEASADHVYEVVNGHPKEWETEDRSIGALLAQRVATPTNVQQVSIPNFQLMRGKECAIARKRYVHLVYGNGPQRISMYVLEGNENGFLRRIATSLLPTVRTRTEAGYNVTEGDANNGRRILLVSTLPQNEEQAIVKNVLETMG